MCDGGVRYPRDRFRCGRRYEAYLRCWNEWAGAPDVSGRATTQRAAPATANAFLTKALPPFYPLPRSTPRPPSDQPAK